MIKSHFLYPPSCHVVKRLVALGDHMLRDTIRSTSLLAEDDALLIERDEGFVFALLALAIHVELSNQVD